MIKKYLASLLIGLIMLLLVPTNTYAAPELDGTCSHGTYRPININGNSTWQIFTPTRTILDMVALKIHPLSEASAKIYLLVWDLTSPERSHAVTEKIALINRGEEVNFFDLGDIDLPLGVYGLYVVPIHDQDVVWELSTTSCYSGGHAIYNDEHHDNEDFALAVYTHNPPASGEAPADPAPDDAGSSVEPGTSVDPGETQTVTPSATTSPSSASSSSRSSSSATTTTPNATPDESARIDINDPEVQAMIAEMMADAQSHRSKGIFGLGGMLGSILTWPVVITALVIIGLFVIGIIVIIVVAYRRSKKSPPKVE